MIHNSQDGHDWHVLEWIREEDGAGFRFRVRWVCPCSATKVTEVRDLDISDKPR